MGIQGLLPLLKSVTEPSHAKLYARQTLGVDGYVWLHRGAIACAQDLALGRPTTKYVDYAMRRILMLKHHGVKPYVVLDGDYLPSKAKTEKERGARRAENAKQGKAALKMGNTKIAHEFFQKAIDVTPEMALRLILALQKHEIEYVVAPYEADAQLAYLEKINLIDGIITEDSDLLVFGCRKILLKMNEFGECVEIGRARLPETTAVSFNGWNDDMFRYMAILSGCDYLSSLPGIGIKSAHKLVRMYKTIDRLIRALRSSFGLSFPADYEEKFRRADHTFTYQTVFCPLKKSLVTWNDPPTPLDETSQNLIGRHFENSIAMAVANGTLNPVTKEKIILPDLDAPGGGHPILNRSKSAPAGNSRLDRFMVPSKHIKALQPRDVNIQTSQSSLQVTPKRIAPRQSERDIAHAKKLRLFESSPDKVQSSDSIAMTLQHGIESAGKFSSFFRKPQVAEVKKKDIDREATEMAAAIEASKASETARQLFEGFQNPIGFEVLEMQESMKGDHNQCSSHSFDNDIVPTPTETEDDSNQKITIEDVVVDYGLPSPPDSQSVNSLVLGWKAAYEHKETPQQSPAAPKALAPLFSSSLRRLGGQALARRSSAPLMREAVRHPFISSRESRPQETTQAMRFFR